MRPLVSRCSAILFVVSAVALWAGTAKIASAQGATLALQGYDPVAYFTFGRPTRGLNEFAVEWDEHRYLFSSAPHRDKFKADPVRYAPQFANFCAMALTRGEVLEANPEYWLVSEGKLYIFGKPIGPGLFKQALAENQTKANVNRGLLLKD